MAFFCDYLSIHQFSYQAMITAGKNRFLCFTSQKKSFEKHENFAKKFEMGEFLT